MLALDIFAKGLNKHGEELCGDTVEIIRDDGVGIVVLADGLGSGVKANILSTLTAKIIGTMVKYRLSIEEAVKTIVATLPVCRVRQIAYSTFTLVKVDKNGAAHIIECDNPPSLVLRDGKRLPLTYSEKVIEGKQIKETMLQLLPGDEVFLFSDGVVHAGIGGVLKLGWQWENIVHDLERMENNGAGSIYSKVTQLAFMCNIFYQGKAGDDSTVVGLKVRHPRQGVVMVGPPLDPARDREVVEILAGTDGPKAVCGGTAANIVARELGEKLITRLDFPDPSVPPTAEIRGIDLVTEGVITLHKTLQILRQYLSCTTTFLFLEDKRDGASRLVRFFLEECTNLKFLVGQGVNPAHSDPGLPIELTRKQEVLEEILSLLQATGKQVEVQYF